MTEVVAALIWDKNKFMICRRPANKARALLWEFVGGKVEPGETNEQALIRECREELAVTVSVGEKFTEVTHEYPDITVHLTLYSCAIIEGTPQLLEHSDLKWITPEETAQYEFCPADTEILKLIEKNAMSYLRPGIYRHFKGNEYELIGVAKHSETRETLVVYRALYGEYGLWVRPAAMWSEIVDTPNGKSERFTFVRDKNDDGVKK